MSQITKKAIRFADSHRTKDRLQIRSRIRHQFNQGHIFPLVSQTLSTFQLMNHKQISNYFNKIFQILEITQIQFLQTQQQNLLIQDLIYLVTQHEFEVPYNLKFIKNGSPYTAVLISYIWNKINPQELAYWLKYMDQQHKQMIYLSVQVEHYPIWTQGCSQIRESLGEDLIEIKCCSEIVKDMLINSYVQGNMYNPIVTMKLVRNLTKYIQNRLKIQGQIEYNQTSYEKDLTVIMMLIILTNQKQGFTQYLIIMLNNFIRIQTIDMQICYWINQCLSKKIGIMSIQTFHAIIPKIIIASKKQNKSEASLQIMLMFLKNARVYQNTYRLSQQIISEINSELKQFCKNKQAYDHLQQRINNINSSQGIKPLYLLK